MSTSSDARRTATSAPRQDDFGQPGRSDTPAPTKKRRQRPQQDSLAYALTSGLAGGIAGQPPLVIACPSSLELISRRVSGPRAARLHSSQAASQKLQSLPSIESRSCSRRGVQTMHAMPVSEPSFDIIIHAQLTRPGTPQPRLSNRNVVRRVSSEQGHLCRDGRERVAPRSFRDLVANLSLRRDQVHGIRTVPFGRLADSRRASWRSTDADALHSS